MLGYMFLAGKARQRVLQYRSDNSYPEGNYVVWPTNLTPAHSNNNLPGTADNQSVQCDSGILLMNRVSLLQILRDIYFQEDKQKLQVVARFVLEDNSTLQHTCELRLLHLGSDNSSQRCMESILLLTEAHCFPRMCRLGTLQVL